MFYIRARKLWSEYRPAFTKVRWLGRKVDVFIHHTADSGPRGGAKASPREEIAYLRRIEKFHVETRGYSAIGYNYLIMPSGRVYEGRGFGIKGAHTLDPKDADNDGRLNENADIGICFAGNFNKQRPTKASLAAYKLLRGKLRLRGVRLDRTYPHRAAFATSCPGNHLVAKLGL